MVAATSRSASGNTMLADLPPSSRVDGRRGPRPPPAIDVPGGGGPAREGDLVDARVTDRARAGVGAADHDVAPPRAGTPPRGPARRTGAPRTARSPGVWPRPCCRRPERAPPSGPCPSSARSTARWRRPPRRARAGRSRGRRPAPGRTRPSSLSTQPGVVPDPAGGGPAGVAGPSTGVPLSTAVSAAASRPLGVEQVGQAVEEGGSAVRSERPPGREGGAGDVHARRRPRSARPGPGRPLPGRCRGRGGCGAARRRRGGRSAPMR